MSKFIKHFTVQTLHISVSSLLQMYVIHIQNPVQVPDLTVASYYQNCCEACIVT